MTEGIKLRDVIDPAITDKFQSIANEMAAQLAKQMAPAIENFQKVTLGPLLKRMGPYLEQMAASAREAMPPNWESEGLSAETLIRRGEMIQTTGLPLVWIPDLKIVRHLDEARDDEARLDILSGHDAEILSHCDECLSSIAHPDIVFLAEATHEAISAFSAGHPRAGQALATAAIDTGYTRLLGHSSASAREDFARDLREQSLTTVRFALAVAPIPVALKRFDPRLDDVPKSYNRHATFHAVTPEQYTKINALIATMVATSCLREWDVFLTKSDAPTKNA